MSNTSLENNQEQNENKLGRKAIKRSGNRIGHNYVIIKSLKKSDKNDVVKCFYMKSIFDFGFCVVKEGTYCDLKDKDNRDIQDRLKWQEFLHKRLERKVSIPKFVGSFEENGNYYLAISNIRGKSIAEILKTNGSKIRDGLISGSTLGRRILNYMLQITDIMELLHKENVVHRDLTLTNFIASRKGKIYLIDFELAYAIDIQSPTPPFQLGTHGYMSPEQQAVRTPTPKEDIFSFGAVLLHLWSNISPIKLTDTSTEDLTEKVQYFIPNTEISQLVIKCLNKNPLLRPELSEIREKISLYLKHIKKEQSISIKNQSANLPESKIKEVIQSTIYAYSTHAFADPNLGWFSEDRKSKDKNKFKKSWYASFHLGASGIMYFLSRAHCLGYDISSCLIPLEQGISLIEKKYIQSDAPLPGLHYGSDGVAVSIRTAITVGIWEDSIQFKAWEEKLLSIESKKGLDIMEGLSGRLMANLIYHSENPNSNALERIQLYADEIIKLQSIDGSWERVSLLRAKKKRVTKGFAYGVSGIIYALLSCGEYLNEKKYIESAEKALLWLINKSKWQEAKVYWTSSTGQLVSPWWCDGAPGVALSFIKGYELTGNELYKKYATAALVIEPHELFENNLSQCNGLSGLGETYLEAYRVFSDREWFTRAGSILQIILRLMKRHEKFGPYWLSEYEQHPIAGFMLGNSGILHFLLRYLHPEKLSLPLTLKPKLIDNAPNCHGKRKSVNKANEALE